MAGGQSANPICANPLFANRHLSPCIVKPRYAGRVRRCRLQFERGVQSIRENALAASQREWINQQMQFVHEIVF
jgi:hypothetical protein